MESSRPRFVGYDPLTVLNVGYAVHASRDPSLEGKKPQELAREIVDRFLALSAPQGSKDEIYLMRIQAIALSLGNGISRRKAEYLKELESAQDEYDQRQERMRSGRNNAIWMTFARRVGGMGIMLGIGVTLAKTMAPFVPEDFGQTTGTTAPSLLSGLVFVLIGNYIRTLWEDYHRGRVSAEYNWRRLTAGKHYEHSKLKEFKQSLGELSRAWKEYTGKPYKKQASYALVIEGDLAAREEYDRKLQEHSMSNARLLFRSFCALFPRRKAAKY